jgi:hypothetical protein
VVRSEEPERRGVRGTGDAERNGVEGTAGKAPALGRRRGCNVAGRLIGSTGCTRMSSCRTDACAALWREVDGFIG